MTFDRNFTQNPHLKSYDIDYFESERQVQILLSEDKGEQAELEFDRLVTVLPEEAQAVAQSFTEEQKKSLLKLKTNWSRQSQYVTWLSSLENDIVNAHREPYPNQQTVRLDPDIRKSNRDYVKAQGVVNDRLQDAYSKYLDECVKAAQPIRSPGAGS